MPLQPQSDRTLFDRFLGTAKAWAALAGAVLTALVGTLTPDDPGYKIVAVALAIATAITVYQVKNRRPTRHVTVRLTADSSQIKAQIAKARAVVDELERRRRAVEDHPEPPIDE